MTLATLGVVAGYPEPAKWMIFAAAVAVGLVDWVWRLTRGQDLVIDLLDLILAALIAYAALSLIWSANRNGGIQTVIIATSCLVLAAYLKRHLTKDGMTALCVAIGLAVLAALVTNLWLPAVRWSGFGNSGYAADSLLLAIPFMWPLWRHPSPIAQIFAVTVTAAAAGYIVIFTPSATGAFVVLMFAAVASIALAFRWRGNAGWVALVAWILIPPLIAWLGWYELRMSARLLIRSELWLNAAFMTAARPLFGHGAGSFIEVYPLFKEAHGDLMPFVNKSFESYVTEAEALHNDPLQLLTELGVVGLLPFLAMVGLAVRAAARRMVDDPFVAAGGAALVAALGISLLEYPFQRCATLFLAVLALGFATHGEAPGIRQWRIPVRRVIPAIALPVSIAAAALLLFASYRQFEAEQRLDATRTPGIDPVLAFNLVYEAHRLDPLERRVRTALPVMLDGLIRARGLAAVPRPMIDQIYRDMDDGGRFNTAALVARAQFLLESSRGEDPSFSGILADLRRGSARVAAVYAIEARYLLMQGRAAEALAAIAEGEKYLDGVSSIPAADASIRANLAELKRLAQARPQDGATKEAH